MIPGDRVQHRATGLTGRVVAVHDHELEVELPSGETLTWTTRTVVALSRTIAPKGVVQASARDLKVEELVRGKGWPRPRVARHFGITESQVASALNRVRDAREDEANRRAG